MRRRAATSRLTLQQHSLPPSAVETELNYRTCITTPRQDGITTLRLASIATLIFIVVGFGLRLIAILPLYVSIPLFAALFLFICALAYKKFLQKLRSTEEILLALTVLLVCVLFGLVNYAPTMRSAYIVIFGTALLLTAALSHFITVQACAFMAVNERIPRPRMKRWLMHLSRFERLETPAECPELTGYRVNFVLLLVAFALGFALVISSEQSERESYAAMAGAVGFVVALIAFKLILPIGPQSPLRETVPAAWQALTIFVCYNRHGVNAAGLFRFPTKALRPSLVRDGCLAVTLAFLTTALVGVSVSSPSVLIARYWNAPKAPETPPEEFRLSPLEERFSQTLSPEQRTAYFEAKKAEHQARENESYWATIRRTILNATIATGLVLLLCWLGPLAVLFGVLWFVAGEVLNRFYQALEAPKAYEVPPEPTKEEIANGARGITPWDNRIERIHLSKDKLETEHLYLGSSIEGDFPVLLHQELLYRHAHILGDTGSRKTSIGIAPLVTQLIAREDHSVIIIDLKGDRTLFNAVKDEAQAVGLPFKHFTNIVGKSSYVFNPLRQSHMNRLTTDQLAQGILQALELEHGEGYGRGHFTALNDLVLTAFYRRYRRHIGSFQELHRYVSDRHAYRTISDSEEDWRHTRQLVNLVEKIAYLGPMNVMAETHKGQPEAIANQIDMPSVLSKPQVIYFFLSSALDPRTVSPVAKLAMFSLLNAAEFRDGISPRCFVFIDEFQRVISEAMTLFFEQARSKGLHFILANQSIGQLNSKGVNITNVIESCTGFKQSFRASDEESIKRIVRTSGDAVYHNMSWTRTVNEAYDEDSPGLLSFVDAIRRRDEDELKVTVSEQYGPRMEANTLIETSALPFGSFVRFVEASGYTQYSGYWTTLLSEYHISKPLYDYYESEPLPPVGPETIEVPGDPEEQDHGPKFISGRPVPTPTNVPEDFDKSLEERLNAAAGTLSKPKEKAP